MKKSIQVFAAALVMFAFSTGVNAQSTATATASATIVTPILLTNNVDMNFGNIAVTASGGTVVLAPAGTRTKTGGLQLPNVTGTVTAAQFTVTGNNDYTYAITLPTTDLTITSAANTMIVNAFTNSLGATGTLSATGSQVFTVGATLTVANGQAAGTYISGTPFDVTVNYN